MTDATTPGTSISGVWEGFSRSVIREGASTGDTRIERQAWNLTQEGEEISGYYVVELTMVSGDGRPYVCSQAPRLQTMLRIEVRGRVFTNGLNLEEIGEPISTGTCAPGPRQRTTFHATIHDNVMTLVDGERRFSLIRRPAGARDEAPDLPASAPGSTSSERTASTNQDLLAALAPDDDGDTSASAEGFWLWENTSAAPGGDERNEREEWHIFQEDTKISGYYDRWVRQLSTDGHPYRCSGTLDFKIGTRFRFTGEVVGNTIAIYERGFEVLDSGPCDTGSRRLDAYHGQISRNEIRIALSTGIQVLHRGRPDVPTQKF